jgi:hypothetical protein
MNGIDQPDPESSIQPCEKTYAPDASGKGRLGVIAKPIVILVALNEYLAQKCTVFPIFVYLPVDNPPDEEIPVQVGVYEIQEPAGKSTVVANFASATD